MTRLLLSGVNDWANCRNGALLISDSSPVRQPDEKDTLTLAVIARRFPRLPYRKGVEAPAERHPRQRLTDEVPHPDVDILVADVERHAAAFG